MAGRRVEDDDQRALERLGAEVTRLEAENASLRALVAREVADHNGLYVLFRSQQRCWCRFCQEARRRWQIRGSGERQEVH